MRHQLDLFDNVQEQQKSILVCLGKAFEEALEECPSQFQDHQEADAFQVYMGKKMALPPEDRALLNSLLELALIRDAGLREYICLLAEAMPRFRLVTSDFDSDEVAAILAVGFSVLPDADFAAFCLNPLALFEIQVLIWMQPSPFWNGLRAGYDTCRREVELDTLPN